MEGVTVAELRQLPSEHFYVTVNGRIVRDWATIGEHSVFRLHLRVLGGKGGFGSLLRSFRIHRSSNQLMCRDLSGRRLADVKQEEKLKKWISKAADRESEKETKRKEKYHRLKQGPPKHQFDDINYKKQKEEILDKADDAFEQGLKSVREKGPGAAESSGIGQKRPADESETPIDEETSNAKRAKMDQDIIEPAEVRTPNETETSKTKKVKQASLTSQKKEDAPPKLTKKQKKELQEAQKKQQQNAPSSETYAPVDLETVNSVMELELLGLEHLKHALDARGLKCGGTLTERAERLFSVKGLAPKQFPKNIVAKKK